MPQPDPSLSSPRRGWLQALGAGAGTMALGGPVSLLMPGSTAAQPRDLILRKIPRTGETIPAIGLGTYLTFDLLPGQAREHIGEIMRRFWEGGGQVIDTSPLYGTGEISVGDFAAAMGITRKMFITNKIWSTGEFLADDSHARRSLEQSMQRLWRETIDVMQVHSLVNVDQILPVLRNWGSGKGASATSGSPTTNCPTSTRSRRMWSGARSTSCRCITPSTPGWPRSASCRRRSTRASRCR